MKIFGLMILLLGVSVTLQTFYRSIGVKRNIHKNDRITRAQTRYQPSLSLRRYRGLNEDVEPDDLYSGDLEVELDSDKQSVDDFTPDEIMTGQTSSNYDYVNDENTELPVETFAYEVPNNEPKEEESDLPETSYSTDDLKSHSDLSEDLSEFNYDPRLNLGALDQRIALLESIRDSAYAQNGMPASMGLGDVGIIEDMIYFLDELGYLEEKLAAGLGNNLVSVRKLTSASSNGRQIPRRHFRARSIRNGQRNVRGKGFEQVSKFLQFKKGFFTNHSRPRNAKAALKNSAQKWSWNSAMPKPQGLASNNYQLKKHSQRGARRTKQVLNGFVSNSIDKASLRKNFRARHQKQAFFVEPERQSFKQFSTRLRISPSISLRQKTILSKKHFVARQDNNLQRVRSNIGAKSRQSFGGLSTWQSMNKKINGI